MTNPLLIVVWIAALPFLVGIMLLPIPTRITRSYNKAKLVAGSTLVQLPLMIWIILAFLPKDQKSAFQWLTLPSGAGSLMPVFYQMAPSSANLILVLFVSVIASAVHGFSLIYIRKSEQPIKFQIYVAGFTFMMVNLILAGNLLQLFMAWELVGLMSWLLIGYDWKHNKSGKAAIVAFLTNRVADLGLMLALAICWVQFGSWDIDQLSGQDLGDFLDGGTGLLLGLCLLIGAMGKSAQLPFQHWLPAAMAGPTPASALIHAATMVTAGIFLLMRVDFLLSGSVHSIMFVIGCLTALSAGYWAIRHHDLKTTLAYSTISQLGFLMMGLGTGHSEATMFHLMVHGIAKAGLFLAAGSIILQVRRHLFDLRHTYPDLAADHHSGQDLRIIGGLWTSLPFTMGAMVISAASLMGLPLLVGFLSKDLLLEGMLHPVQNVEFGTIMAAFGLLVAVLTSTYLTRLIGLLLLPALLRLDRGWEHHSYILWSIPLGLAAGGVFILHSSNPFGLQLFWLTVHQQDLPTLVPMPLLAIIASGIGIVVGLLLARKDRFGWWQLVKESNAQGLTILPNPDPDLNQQWLKAVTNLANYIGQQISPVFAKADTIGIDYIVNQTSKGTIMLARLLNFLERYVIDGIVVACQWLAITAGKEVSLVGGRKVQGYLGATMLVGAIAAAIWLW